VSSSAADGQSILKDAMRKNGWTWATIPFEFEGYWAYAALDTCITAKLHQILKDKMTKQETEVYEMELAVNHILREAETRGARVDLDYTRDLLQTWNFEMFNLRDEIKELGVENPNANKQIEVALKIEGWEPEEWTAKGNIKLDEGILKGLDFPIVQKILDYKKLKKWTKAYLSTFLDNADERGYLHADIHTLAAITGRMSITKPALQTLPRGPEIRNCIVASEGRHLLAIDYSQIEYRLFAHFSGEEKMITAMRNPATDFHSATAEIIFGPDYTSQQRSLSKNCNFAWLYGAGPARLAKTANKDEHVLTEDQARAILEQYRQTFPGAAQFMKEVERVAQERTNSEGRPYIYTPGGRKLFAEPDKNYTLVNFLCQGSAAEVLKNKIIELDNKGLTKYLILPIHDELLWDVPDEEWDTLVPQIKETMEDLTTFEVPLTVTVSEKLERWGDNAK
jgi:DNA polymerase-1